RDRRDQRHRRHRRGARRDPDHGSAQALVRVIDGAALPLPIQSPHRASASHGEGQDTGNRMSQQTTIRKLAELVNTPVEKLLEQLAEAGMTFSGPDQVVTSIEKVKLLGFLKRSHGKGAKAADEIVAPS